MHVFQLEFCTYFTSLPCPLHVIFVRGDSGFSMLLSGQMLVSVRSEQAAISLSVLLSICPSVCMFKVSNSSQVDNGWQPDWTSHVTCWPFALSSYKHAMRICHTIWRKLGWRPAPISPLHLLSSTSFPLLHFFPFYFVTLQFLWHSLGKKKLASYKVCTRCSGTFHTKTSHWTNWVAKSIHYPQKAFCQWRSTTEILAIISGGSCHVLLKLSVR